MAFSFFSGKRLVPIMASVVMLGVTVVLLFVWPPIYDALVAFGKTFMSMGAIGAGLYGFFNRLLIPTALHQALNSVFWFDVAGINDIGKFLSSQGPKGITGMYQAGFFPVMMFGLPAGALAIYKNARPENKKVTASLMLAGAFASFFTGVTEPLEFSFMFVAWPLYVIHAAFTGISLAFAAFMHWTAGFAFSAGLVDFVLSLKNPIANQPYMLVVQGLVMAVIYYFGFDFAIKKFHLMTPGREKAEAADVDAEVDTDSDDDKYTRQAKKIYAAIGGFDNITEIDNCPTRLRLQLDDTDKINKNAIKSAGAAGVNVLDKTNLQIIIGTEVQFTADALSKLYDAKEPVSAVTTVQEPASSPVEEKDDPSIHSGATDAFYSVANGELLNIEEVSDPTFAQKMIGDGYAVEPTDGEIVSPVSGEITTIFPTKHAMGIKTDNGLEVLVHIGLDTLELAGEPFDLHVSEGDKVEHGTPLATVDLDGIKAAGKQTTMLVVVTNMPVVGYFKFSAADRQVAADAEVLQVTIR
jgi:PTS system N-acetylglucosamine-specific IIC component